MLLLWGVDLDIRNLRRDLVELHAGRLLDVRIGPTPHRAKLVIRKAMGTGLSIVEGNRSDLAWSCSEDVLIHCVARIETMLSAPAGHQYVEIQSSFIDEVMISMNEYPADL